MANEVQVSTSDQLKKWFSNESLIKQLGSQISIPVQSFTSSILSVVNNNKYLRNADPASIYGAAMIAASLNLQVNPSLGECAIIPYGRQAQFQIMTKGLLKFALNSKRLESLINEVVYEGQLVKKDKFRGVYEFDEDAKTSDKVIGYMAYLRTKDGYEKTLYMTVDEINAHAKKFSQTFRAGSGIWKDNYDAMALKTVLKQLLVKWCPKAVIPNVDTIQSYDQAVVKMNPDEGQNSIDDADVEFVDNSKTDVSSELAKAAELAIGFENEEEIKEEPKSKK